MLPGNRTFTDDDIVATIGEALTVYERINADGEVPMELRPLVFQSCVNMVGNRTLTGGMEIPGRRL